MKKSIILSIIFGLAVTSINVYAQKKPSNSANSSVPVSSNVQTIFLIEEATQGTKGGPVSNKPNTFRLEFENGKEASVSFAGPVRVCQKYGSANFGSAIATTFKATLSSKLKDIKDKNGKATYSIPSGDPEDDKAKTQLCYTLTSQ